MLNEFSNNLISILSLVFTFFYKFWLQVQDKAFQSFESPLFQTLLRILFPKWFVATYAQLHTCFTNAQAHTCFIKAQLHTWFNNALVHTFFTNAQAHMCFTNAQAHILYQCISTHMIYQCTTRHMLCPLIPPDNGVYSFIAFQNIT